MFTTYVKFLLIILISGFPLTKGIIVYDKRLEPFESGLGELFENEETFFKGSLHKLVKKEEPDTPILFKNLKNLTPKPSSLEEVLDSIFDEDKLAPLVEPVVLYPDEPSLHLPETNVLEMLKTYIPPPVIEHHVNPTLPLPGDDYYPEGWREYYLGILEKLAVDVTDVLPDEYC